MPQSFSDFTECLERCSLMGFSDDPKTGEPLEPNDSFMQLLRSIDRCASLTVNPEESQAWCRLLYDLAIVFIALVYASWHMWMNSKLAWPRPKNVTTVGLMRPLGSCVRLSLACMFISLSFHTSRR
jgi:hypothetical protein